jgi:hypothetical protein
MRWPTDSEEPHGRRAVGLQHAGWYYRCDIDFRCSNCNINYIYSRCVSLPLCTLGPFGP